MKKFCLSLCLAVMVISSSGCIALIVGAAAGAGSIIWIKGKLAQDFNVPLDKTYNATITAIKKLELQILVDRKDKFSAKIESKFADGANVWVDLEYLTVKSSKVSVRVGTLGDEARSRQIMSMIEKYL